MKTYSVVYPIKQYQVTYKNHIPTEHAANIIIKKAKQLPYMQEHADSMSIIETEEPGERKKCRIHNGRHVLNEDYFYYDALCKGTLIEDDVVDELINSLPPRYLSHSLFQSGEPCSMRMDGDKARNTYATYVRVDKNTWMFCEDCFYGESEQRGKEIAYA